MNVAFRVDACEKIGTGHFMRCLTLADALKQRGVDVRFVSRHMFGYLKELLKLRGHQFHQFEVRKNCDDLDNLQHSSWLGVNQSEDATDTKRALADLHWDWLVVDHYALDCRWEERIRPLARRIFAIDDLANRSHDAELLLDQNLYVDMNLRYVGLTKSGSRQLLGPGYALLREEFIDIRRNLRQRDGRVQRIFVFFGGSDLTNETGKALDAISMLSPSKIRYDVVVGEANPHRQLLLNRCASMPSVRLHFQVSHMGELMSVADLSLGAGGTTTWERCATGLPSLVVSVAENQVAIAKGVAKLNGHRYLGLSHQVSAELIAASIEELLQNPEALREMCKAALAIVDTCGTDRVVSQLRNFD